MLLGLPTNVLAIVANRERSYEVVQFGKDKFFLLTASIGIIR